MDWLSGLVLSFLGGIAAIWFWERTGGRYKEHAIDDKALSLLNTALMLLPDEDREIYEEEWFMYLCDLESSKDRLLHAFMFLLAAAKISADVKILGPAISVTSLARKYFLEKFSLSEKKSNRISSLFGDSRFTKILFLWIVTILGSLIFMNFSSLFLLIASLSLLASATLITIFLFLYMFLDRFRLAVILFDRSARPVTLLILYACLLVATLAAVVDRLL